MTTYYVATMARYVLVEAENESQARERGRQALNEQYADLRERLGRDIPIEIRTVRLATDNEIQLYEWHHEMVSRDQQTMQP
jgi:hypothetical protein